MNPNIVTPSFRCEDWTQLSSCSYQLKIFHGLCDIAHIGLFKEEFRELHQARTSGWVVVAPFTPQKVIIHPDHLELLNTQPEDISCQLWSSKYEEDFQKMLEVINDRPENVQSRSGCDPAEAFDVAAFEDCEA